jgi:hypothetical protein
VLPSPDVLADADAESPAELDELDDPGLAPAELPLPLAGAFVALCVGEELADSDGLVSGCGVGLAEEAALLGVVRGLALWLGLDDSQLGGVLGWAVGLPLLLTVLDVVVVVAADEALAVPLALALELAGALPPVVPVAGVLAAELPEEEEEDDDEGPVTEAAGEDDEDEGLDGLDELAGAVAEGEAEPCGHDEIGVGS